MIGSFLIAALVWPLCVLLLLGSGALVSAFAGYLRRALARRARRQLRRRLRVVAR